MLQFHQKIKLIGAIKCCRFIFVWLFLWFGFFFFNVIGYRYFGFKLYTFKLKGELYLITDNSITHLNVL